MNSVIRFAALAGIACASTLLAPEASAADPVFNYGGDPHYVHIDEPEVKQAQSRTPIFVFPGDRVWLRAGGCVQTGGRGKTWKRYVNPSGPNSYWNYHGQVQIPGAVEGFTNLNQLVGDDGGWSRMFSIGSGNPNSFAGQISVGYTDDGYDDNGYWGHDDGTENQCRGIGNAWLELYICRADAAHGATC